MKRSCILFFLFLLLIPILGKSQLDSIRLNKQYVAKYWTDTKGIVSAPFHWDEKDWYRFGAFIYTTGALFLLDEPVNELMQNHQSSTVDKVSKYGLEPFFPEYIIATCGILYGGSLLLKERKLESTTLLAFESCVLASAFVRIPKYLLGRSRPNKSDDVSPFEFGGPFYDDSFPSGHTIAVFSVATVFANQYREKKWIPLTVYPLAGLVGLSRVYDNSHWLSDVFTGAVMGIAIGNLVCPSNKNKLLSIMPTRMGSAYGMYLSYCF